jgi:hypothetical protein
MKSHPLSVLSGFVLLSALLTGCAGSAKAPPKPVPELSSQTSFADLQAVFFAKYPTANRLVKKDGMLPLTAQESNDVTGADKVANADFMKWCELRGGTAYQEVSRTSVPVEVREAARTGESIFQLEANQYVSAVNEPACVIAGKTHLLYSARAFYSPGGRVHRALAWISPEDLATHGPRAQQTLDERLRKRMAAEQSDKDAEGVSQRRAAENKSAFLDRTPKGTQVNCDGRQSTGQSINAMTFHCNGVSVFFGEFAQHGWRITSQNVVPQVMNGVPQGAQVGILVEKVR